MIASIVLLSVACKTTTDRSQTSLENLQKWQQHQLELEKLSTFKANGSLAYLSNKTKHYARFFLNQKSYSDYELKLTTPLGGTVMTLISTPNQAVVINSDGKKYYGPNVEELLNQLTGMNIPLQSIHQWLIGLSNNPIHDQLNSNGYLKQTELLHNGEVWSLTIPYYSTLNKIALPTSIDLTHKDEQIRIKINNWML